jgi:choline transporter-like protein 2/4/5
MSCCEALDPCCRRIGCACKAHEGTMAGLEKKRTCTDIPCLIVFAAFIAFLVSYSWGKAYADGDADRIIYGVDYKGRICGKSEGVEDKPLAFWPAPEDSYQFKVCTDSCDVTTDTDYVVTVYPTEEYLDSYCLPSSNSPVQISGFNDGANKFSRQIGDLQTAIPVIGASIGIALLMAFFYISLMKCCVGVLVWGTIGGIIVGGFYLAYNLLQKAKDVDNDQDKQTYQICGYSILGLTIIFLCIIIFARQRIAIAVEVIKSASRAINDMPLMVFFPIWPLLLCVGFFFVWLYASIYIFSVGEKIEIDVPTSIDDDNWNAFGETSSSSYPQTFQVLDHQNTIETIFAPHFFLLLWVIQILVYSTFTIIAGAVADWYFAKRDEHGKKIRGNEQGNLSKKPVLSSCGRTIRYHLGTILYAALLIAIIQFIRCCIRYFERIANGGNKPNKLQKILLKMVDCCLWCLEKCLDKISRNAFCPAVCGSFALIWANLMRVAVISFFSTIVTALGKILVPLLTVAICSGILTYVEPFKSEVDSLVMPNIIILIISAAVGVLFLTVYDTAIDTVFMCFLIDEKHNKGTGQMMADDGLRNIVQKYEAESKQIASTMQRSGNAVTDDAIKEAVQI